MRWQQASAVVLALGAMVGLPAVGQGGWLTLTSGVAGAVDPFASGEFWFSFPGGTPAVAVNQLSGTGTVQAVTGGGVSHFGGLGTPVILSLADGSAYLAAGEPPAGATGRTPTGLSPKSAATAAPVSGGTIPTTAALLGIQSAERAEGGHTLTVSVTDRSGAVLGTGTLDVPTGGWWVIGMGPDAKPATNPGGDPGEEPNPGNGGNPPTNPGPTPGVPEPATLALGLVGLAAASWRRVRSRR